MAFQLKGISPDHFHQLNQYFDQGGENEQLLQSTQQLKHPDVEGQSTEWYFNGIRMGYSEWKYRRPTELYWTYDTQVELVTIQANLKGAVYMGNSSQNIKLFDNYQHNLFYANAQDSNEGFLKPDNLQASLFFIQFTRNAFLQMTHNASEELNRFNDDVKLGRSTLLTNNNLPLTANMVYLINSIVSCKYQDNLKKMFLLSKSIEFLVLQAAGCYQSESSGSQYIKTKQDRDCLMYANEYLMSHLDSPPTLSELARIAGINEFKLKRGFKELFGNTVFGYISEARLEKARIELLENKKSSAEIAYSLGYSSPQHFSAAFKKKFGYSPASSPGVRKKR